jgi:hypothetical protein
LQAGACGCVSKGAMHRELLPTIESAIEQSRHSGEPNGPQDGDASIRPA